MYFLGSFKKEARTLWHGTSSVAAKSIMQEGLIPSVGQWTESAYGGDRGWGTGGLLDTSFAADREELSRAMGGIAAQVAGMLGKDFDEVTDEEFMEHGALIKVTEGDREMEHYHPGNEGVQYFPQSQSEPTIRTRQDSDYDPDSDEFPLIDEYEEERIQEELKPNAPAVSRHVEPGDWFTREEIPPERLSVLTGKKMIDVFRRAGLWPRMWGPSREDNVAKQWVAYQMRNHYDEWVDQMEEEAEEFDEEFEEPTRQEVATYLMDYSSNFDLETLRKQIPTSLGLFERGRDYAYGDDIPDEGMEDDFMDDPRESPNHYRRKRHRNSSIEEFVRFANLIIEGQSDFSNSEEDDIYELEEDDIYELIQGLGDFEQGKTQLSEEDQAKFMGDMSSVLKDLISENPEESKAPQVPEQIQDIRDEEFFQLEENDNVSFLDPSKMEDHRTHVLEQKKLGIQELSSRSENQKFTEKGSDKLRSKGGFTSEEQYTNFSRSIEDTNSFRSIENDLTSDLLDLEPSNVNYNNLIKIINQKFNDHIDTALNAMMEPQDFFLAIKYSVYNMKDILSRRGIDTEDSLITAVFQYVEDELISNKYQEALNEKQKEDKGNIRTYGRFTYNLDDIRDGTSQKTFDLGYGKNEKVPLDNVKSIYELEYIRDQLKRKIQEAEGPGEKGGKDVSFETKMYLYNVEDELEKRLDWENELLAYVAHLWWNYDIFAEDVQDAMQKIQNLEHLEDDVFYPELLEEDENASPEEILQRKERARSIRLEALPKAYMFLADKYNAPTYESMRDEIDETVELSKGNISAFEAFRRKFPKLLNSALKNEIRKVSENSLKKVNKQKIKAFKEMQDAEKRIKNAETLDEKLVAFTLALQTAHTSNAMADDIYGKGAMEELHELSNREIPEKQKRKVEKNFRLSRLINDFERFADNYINLN